MKKDQIYKINKVTEKTLRAVKKRQKKIEESIEEKKDMQDLKIRNYLEKRKRFNEEILELNKSIQKKVKNLLN